MADRRTATPLRAAAICALAVTITSCASTAPPAAVSCPDLSGTYENQSTDPGLPLAPFFFGENQRAKLVSLASESNSSIVASTPVSRVVLAIDRDFVCSTEGVRLTKADARNIRLPPLFVQSQTIHYVFTKGDDGSLRMTPYVASKGTSFGIPITSGKEQQRTEFRWRRIEARQ